MSAAFVGEETIDDPALNSYGLMQSCGNMVRVEHCFALRHADQLFAPKGPGDMLGLVSAE